MSGTKAGGLKAAATNRKIYGDQFYKNIGRKGGQNGHTGGFASNPALARVAGARGGRMSKRSSNTMKKCDECKEQIKVMYEDDLLSYEQMAKVIGVSHRSLAYYIRTRIAKEY